MKEQNKAHHNLWIWVLLGLIYLFESAALYPWMYMAGLSLMALDGGLRWEVAWWIFPLLLYPIWMVAGIVASVILVRKERKMAALLAAVVSPVLSFGCFLAMIIITK